MDSHAKCVSNSVCLYSNSFTIFTKNASPAEQIIDRLLAQCCICEVELHHANPQGSTYVYAGDKVKKYKFWFLQIQMAGSRLDVGFILTGVVQPCGGSKIDLPS